MFYPLFRDWGRLTSLYFPGSSFLLFLKIGVTFTFLQFWGSSPSPHNPLKIIKSGLTGTSASTSAFLDAPYQGPWTYICPVYLSIPWSDRLPSRVSLPSSSLRFWPVGPDIPEHHAGKAWGKQGIQYLSSVSHVTRSPAACRSGLTFASSSFSQLHTCSSSCCLWHPLPASTLSVVLGFPNRVCSDAVSIFLYSPCFHSLYASFLCLGFARKSLFFQAGFLTFLLYFPLTDMDLTLEEGVLEYQPAFLGPSSLQDVIPQDSQKGAWRGQSLLSCSQAL